MSTEPDRPEAPGPSVTFRFTLVLDGPLDEHVGRTLVEAWGWHATFGSTDGVHYVELDWPAASFAEALASTMGTAERTGVRVRRVEPDDLVTATEIAERLGRSRESVRLLASGARGGGGFPAPVSHLRERSRLWRWSEVAAWSGDLDPDESDRAEIVAVVNAALEYRRHATAAPPFVRSLVGDPGKAPPSTDKPKATPDWEPSETTSEGFRPARPEPFWSRPR